MSAKNDIKHLLQVIAPYGYTVVKTKKHRKILNQNKQAIYSFSSTPSDRNFEKRIILDLRRLGIIEGNRNV